jgi:hypothetical protein
MKEPITGGMNPEKYSKHAKEVDLTGFVARKELVEAYNAGTNETFSKRLKEAYNGGKLSFNPHRIVYFFPWQIEEIIKAFGHPYGRKE